MKFDRCINVVISSNGDTTINIVITINIANIDTIIIFLLLLVF